MSQIDYYEVLGISSSAEEFVIRAAYKALVQRYHPDKYQGDKAHATERMHQINEAYAVLSDAIKRKNYDASRQSQQSGQTHSQGQQSQQNRQQTNESEADRAWKIAVEYHPELPNLLAGLRKFSDELAEEFKIHLVESKRFNEAKQLAKKAEQTFLEDYFGSDTRVVEFARKLLLEGHKQAAKEFNETLIAMGSSVDIQKVIDTVELKYMPHQAVKRKAQQDDWRRKDADKRAKEVQDALQRIAETEGYLRWDKYLSKYQVSQKRLSKAIDNGKLRSKLIDERDVKGVIYVEDKALPFEELIPILILLILGFLLTISILS